MLSLRLVFQAQVEGLGVDVGPAQPIDIAQNVLEGVRIAEVAGWFEQLHAQVSHVVEDQRSRLVGSRSIADGIQQLAVGIDDVVDHGQQIVLVHLPAQIDGDEISLLVDPEFELDGPPALARYPDIVVADGLVGVQQAVAVPGTGRVHRHRHVVDVVLARRDRTDELVDQNGVGIDEFHAVGAARHVRRVEDAAERRQIQPEETVVDVVGRLDDVLAHLAALAVERLGRRFGFLLAGHDGEVGPSHLAGDLDAEQSRLVGTVAEQLGARQGQAHVAGLDGLDDLVLGALVGQPDLGALRTDGLAVVLHVDLDLLADGAVEVDLELLLHVQGREERLARDTLVGDELVADRTLAGDGDVLATADPDLGLLAAADDLFQRARQLDRDGQVDQSAVAFGALLGAHDVEHIAAFSDLRHALAARKPQVGIVEEQLDLFGLDPAGRVIEKTTGQRFRIPEQKEVLGVPETRKYPESTVVLQHLHLSLEVEVHPGQQVRAEGRIECRSRLRFFQRVDTQPQQALPQVETVDTEQSRIVRRPEHRIESGQEKRAVVRVAPGVAGGQRRQDRRHDDHRRQPRRPGAGRRYSPVPRSRR